MKPGELNISVGLLTDGFPEYNAAEYFGMEGFVIRNLLIGHGFHWRKKLETFVPGTITVLSESQPPVRSVMTLPLEQYVLSVISSEMNPEAPLEFLKAHAVISRSWAARKILDKTGCPDPGKIHRKNLVIDWEEADSHIGFDVCSDDHCQRFQGFAENIPASAAQAVESTRGLVLKDKDGKIADARFSKCCGGRTELFSSCWGDKDFDYLISREDPWCDLSGMEESARNAFLSSVLKNYDLNTRDFYAWSRSVGKQWLREQIIKKYELDVGNVKAMNVVDRGPSGRVMRLVVEGDQEKIEIGKELAIRRLLAPDCLYSSRFEIKDAGDRFELIGRGWGHGVGLCQIGAARMAAEGQDFRQIVDFYYPSASLEYI